MQFTEKVRNGIQVRKVQLKLSPRGKKRKEMKKYEAHKIIFDSLKCTIPRQSNLNACQSIKK